LNRLYRGFYQEAKEVGAEVRRKGPGEELDKVAQRFLIQQGARIDLCHPGAPQEDHGQAGHKHPMEKGLTFPEGGGRRKR
jgi:hypothetical protein